MMKTKSEPTVINVRGLFLDFVGMASHGYATLPKADTKICFYLGMMCGVDKEESEWLTIYLLENWYAYIMDIVDGNYKYVNLTEMVYKAWLEHKASNRG